MVEMHLCFGHLTFPMHKLSILQCFVLLIFYVLHIRGELWTPHQSLLFILRLTIYPQNWYQAESVRALVFVAVNGTALFQSVSTAMYTALTHITARVEFSNTGCLAISCALPVS